MFTKQFSYRGSDGRKLPFSELSEFFLLPGFSVKPQLSLDELDCVASLTIPWDAE
ncbi:hypothetical protein [Anabaena sp. CCY 9614]|uniref:hypothetical protein n=1 Tax=Anabaena sp. CCY 9614 TaxID=3103869 RepID=UPI0039C66BBD